MQQQQEEADVGLTTLGELAELVQRYDRLRSAAASESTEYEVSFATNNAIFLKAKANESTKSRAPCWQWPSSTKHHHFWIVYNHG